MVSGGGGPSSLRRMRKKELLRQYWTQDMNMDDPASNTGKNSQVNVINKADYLDKNMRLQSNISVEKVEIIFSLFNHYSTSS